MHSLMLILANLCMAKIFNSSHPLWFWIFGLLSCYLSYTWIQSSKEKSKWNWSLTFFFLCLPHFTAPFDDDFSRYRFEGQVVNEGYNPYSHAPQHPDIKDHYLQFGEEINHDHWTAIYGPIFIRMMAIFEWLSFDSLSYKFLYLLLIFTCSWLLYRIQPCKKIALHFLYSPFILFEGLSRGHLDLFLAFGALALIYGFQSSKFFFSILGVLFSLGIKWWLIPLIPLLIRRGYLIRLSIGCGLCIILSLPFILDIESLTHSLFEFKSMRSHGHGYDFFSWIFGNHLVYFIVGILLSRLVYLIWLGGNLAHQLWSFFRWLIVLLPALHPWYLIMPLSMALACGQRASFMILGALALGLNDGEILLNSTGVWEQHLLFGLPFFVAVCFRESFLRRSVLREHGEKRPQMSIVTPVHQEWDNLHHLAWNLGQHRHQFSEWIIVDSGQATEKELNTMKNLNARVFSCSEPGRGPQILKGIHESQSDWVLILHADTRLESNAFRELFHLIREQEGLVGGAFKMKYRSVPDSGLLQLLNEIKTRFWSISFGDQSQFIHKKRLELKGGFPDYPLMEDVELSLRMKGGITGFISKSHSLTSGRRWFKKGRFKNATQIIYLLLWFLSSRQFLGHADVKALFKKYYG